MRQRTACSQVAAGSPSPSRCDLDGAGAVHLGCGGSGGDHDVQARARGRCSPCRRRRLGCSPAVQVTSRPVPAPPSWLSIPSSGCGTVAYGWVHGHHRQAVQELVELLGRRDESGVGARGRDQPHELVATGRRAARRSPRPTRPVRTPPRRWPGPKVEQHRGAALPGHVELADHRVPRDERSSASGCAGRRRPARSRAVRRTPRRRSTPRSARGCRARARRRVPAASSSGARCGAARSPTGPARRAGSAGPARTGPRRSRSAGRRGAGPAGRSAASRWRRSGRRARAGPAPGGRCRAGRPGPRG